jgi:hypothetical protein
MSSWVALHVGDSVHAEAEQARTRADYDHARQVYRRRPLQDPLERCVRKEV